MFNCFRQVALSLDERRQKVYIGIPRVKVTKSRIPPIGCIINLT